MPSYDFQCQACGCQFELTMRMYEASSDALCPRCSGPARQLLHPFTIGGCSFVPYTCPVTGKPITTRTAHNENLKRQGCRVLESGEKEAAVRQRQESDRQLDKAVETTVEAAIDAMPSVQREQLAKEFCAGADATVVRSAPNL